MAVMSIQFEARRIFGSEQLWINWQQYHQHQEFNEEHRASKSEWLALELIYAGDGAGFPHFFHEHILQYESTFSTPLK